MPVTLDVNYSRCGKRAKQVLLISNATNSLSEIIEAKFITGTVSDCSHNSSGYIYKVTTNMANVAALPTV